MQQAELEFAATHARRTDPATSKHAASSMPIAAAAQRERVYWSLLRAGQALTADEIAQREGMTIEQVCRRLSELAAPTDGRVEAAEDTRPTRTGRMARLWRIRPTRGIGGGE